MKLKRQSFCDFDTDPDKWVFAREKDLCTFSVWNQFLLTGTLTVEEVYKDRDQFASLVREVAAPDVGRMGIEVLSFTIKDVYDNVTYLASLGKQKW